MSLQRKLIILIFLTSLLISVSIAYYTYNSLEKYTLAQEVDNVEQVITIEFSNVISQYINLSNNKINQTKNMKETLKVEARNILGFIQSLNDSPLPNSEKATIIKSSIDYDNLENVRSAIFSKYFNSTFQHLISSSTANDITGKPVASYTKYENLPPIGKYAVFQIDFRNKSETVLAFFMPINLDGFMDKSVIVTFASLDILEVFEQDFIDRILNHTKVNFDNISLYPGAFISLLQGKDDILIYRGAELNTDLSLIADLDEKLKQSNSNIFNFRQFIDNEEYLLQVGYLKPLDWYIYAGIPIEQLRKFGQNITINQIIFAIVLTTISIIISIMILLKTINPLQILTKKVQDFSLVNMASEKSLQEFADGLEAKTNDEIGLLTNSIKELTNELSTQVTNLVEATSTKERMQGELNAAREIQMDILNSPENAPCANNFTSSYFLEPAKEVGGDLYDYRKLEDGRYLIIVGDVSGKGVGAALFMSITVTILRHAFISTTNLGSAINNLNNLLSAHNESNMFVTLFAAILDAETGEFEYVNGGHCPPLVINQKTKELRKLEGLSGPMVGVFDGMDYIVHKDIINKDELVLIFSDGVTEAMDEDLKLYSDERLDRFVIANYDANPQKLITLLYQSIIDFRKDAEPSDDITIACFNRKNSL